MILEKWLYTGEQPRGMYYMIHEAKRNVEGKGDWRDLHAGLQPGLV